MSQSLEVGQLDKIVSQLCEVQDDLDDFRKVLIMPRIGRPFVANPDPASRFTHLVVTLFGALALVTCSVQVGIMHGRASCPAPNVAQVGP